MLEMWEDIPQAHQKWFAGEGCLELEGISAFLIYMLWTAFLTPYIHYSVHEVTEAGVQSLLSLGVKTVFDLRSIPEVQNNGVADLR